MKMLAALVSLMAFVAQADEVIALEHVTLRRTNTEVTVVRFTFEGTRDDFFVDDVPCLMEWVGTQGNCIVPRFNPTNAVLRGPHIARALKEVTPRAIRRESLHDLIQHLHAQQERPAWFRELKPIAVHELETDTQTFTAIEFDGVEPDNFYSIRHDQPEFVVSVDEHRCLLSWQGERAWCVVPRIDVATAVMRAPSERRARLRDTTRGAALRATDIPSFLESRRNEPTVPVSKLRVVSVHDATTKLRWQKTREWSVFQFEAPDTPLPLPTGRFLVDESLCAWVWAGRRGTCIVPRVKNLDTAEVWGAIPVSVGFLPTERLRELRGNYEALSLAGAPGGEAIEAVTVLEIMFDQFVSSEHGLRPTAILKAELIDTRKHVFIVEFQGLARHELKKNEALYVGNERCRLTWYGKKGWCVVSDASETFWGPAMVTTNARTRSALRERAERNGQTFALGAPSNVFYTAKSLDDLLALKFQFPD